MNVDIRVKVGLASSHTAEEVHAFDVRLTAEQRSDVLYQLVAGHHFSLQT